jgi:hypothetical protein
MFCDEGFIRRFLESENERPKTIRSADEHNPPRRSDDGEDSDGGGE